MHSVKWESNERNELEEESKKVDWWTKEEKGKNRWIDEKIRFDEKSKMRRNYSESRKEERWRGKELKIKSNEKVSKKLNPNKIIDRKWTKIIAKRIDIEHPNDKWDKDKENLVRLSNIDRRLNKMNIETNPVEKENIRHVLDRHGKDKNRSRRRNIETNFDFDKSNENESDSHCRQGANNDFHHWNELFRWSKIHSDSNLCLTTDKVENRSKSDKFSSKRSKEKHDSNDKNRFVNEFDEKHLVESIRMLTFSIQFENIE